MHRPKSRHVERQARRMHEMMEHMGVDAGRLARLDHGDAYAEARLKCLDCGETERCLRWLESSPTSREPPAFCPNVKLFAFCARD